MAKISLLVGFLLLLLQPAFGQVPINKDVNYIAIALSALEKGQLDSMAACLGKARDICLTDGRWETCVTGFTDVAKTLYNRGYTYQGIQLLRRLQQDARQYLREHITDETEIYYQMARGFYFEKMYDSCVTYTMHNIDYLERLSRDETALERANHYNLLGAAYNAMGQSARALQKYEQVLAIRIANLGTEDNQIASIYFNMGNAYSNLKLYNKALDAYIKGIKIREKALGSQHPTLASIYFNVGVMYDDKGEYDNAILFFERALEIFQEHPGRFADQIADVFNNLAISYKNKGAYQESSTYHQQSIRKYEQLSGSHSDKMADVYTNLAILAGLRKAYTEAIELHEKAWHLYQQRLEPNDPRLLAAANNLGIAYADAGDYEGALAQLRGLASIMERNAGQQEQFANLNNDIGEVYFQLGDWMKAKTFNLRALDIQQKIFSGKSYKLAITSNNLARIALEEKDYPQALKYLQQALMVNHANFNANDPTEALRASGYLRYEYFVESLLLKAKLLSVNGNEPAGLLQAKSLYRIADTVLAEVQKELISSEDKLRLAENIYELSQWAVENCFQLANATGEQGYLEEAFEYVEKSKNMVLKQSIAANHAKHFAGIPDSLVQLEDQLQSNIRYYKLQLAEKPDSAAALLYNNELFLAQMSYRTLIRQLEEAYPLYHQLRYDRTVPSVQALQAVLPAQTALLSYFISDSALFCFVITQQNFQAYRTPISGHFYNQLVGLRKSIAWQLNEDYIELAYPLYQQLFPFELEDQIESLVIISDGALSKLPFEALLMHKTSLTNGFATLPYLVSRYNIRYALSGALFQQQQSRMTEPSVFDGGLIAYAPVFAEPQKVELFSSGTRNPLVINDNQRVGRAITMDGQYVAALPATADEVQAITSVFQQKGQSVSAFMFQEANENQLKRGAANRSQYIHIATHGFINEAQPDMSGLLLFPNFDGQEDHILYSGEVYGLQLQAELVVLSACETGLGKVAKGEGLLGLSRAFLYAGAQNLVVSLWKVQDRATAELMVKFYQWHLDSEHRQFAQPLRQAKLDMIRSETFSHPYYWSAFVLIGR